MSKQPHHMLSGLHGLYMPNINFHYDSKAEALDALVDWKKDITDQVWMMRQVAGQHVDLPQGNCRRDGYFFFDNGNQIAEVVPCPTPHCQKEME